MRRDRVERWKTEPLGRVRKTKTRRSCEHAPDAMTSMPVVDHPFVFRQPRQCRILVEQRLGDSYPPSLAASSLPFSESRRIETLRLSACDSVDFLKLRERCLAVTALDSASDVDRAIAFRALCAKVDESDDTAGVIVVPHFMAVQRVTVIRRRLIPADFA